MIPREDVEELANVHASLQEEPTTAAIWIHRDRPEAWLVEVIPAMNASAEADDPIFFNPGLKFRFPLALIAGNRRSLEDAVRRNPELARAIADGDVIVDRGDAVPLVNLARQVAA